VVYNFAAVCCKIWSKAGKMKKILFSIAAILPLAAWAQTPGGQITYTLQAKYKQGEVLRYQTSMLTQTILPTMGTSTMNLNMVQEQKIDKVLPDGSAEITLTTLNGRGTLNDKPIDMETNKKPIRMVFDKRGNVKKLLDVPKDAQNLGGMFGGNSQLSGTYLPTKPVKFGESWTATIAMPTNGGGKTTAMVKSSFVRIEQIGRFRTARLRSQLTAPMVMMTDGQGQITQNAAKALLKLTGKITMNYDTNFAIDDGKLIRSSVKGGIDMTGKVLTPTKPAPKPTKAGAKAKSTPAQTVAIQVKMQMGNSLIE
jgi:hypothetical protein